MLNTQQQLAVSLNHKTNALILAGAGTGKTRVLTQRIIYLIEHKFITLPEILAITFTNKAANEMFGRIKSHYYKNNYSNYNDNDNDNEFSNSWIGTFHKICYQILLQNYEFANLNKDFQIIDEIKQNDYISNIIKSLNLDNKIYDSKKICYLINSYKNLCLRSFVDVSLLRTEQFYNLKNNIDINAIQTIYQQYEQFCQQQNFVDFDELLLRCYELFLHNEQCRLKYQNLFKYILVDEFQDTNILQYKLIKLLLTNNANSFLFVVADDNQIIYSFRGTDANILQKVIFDFPDLITIKLEQNYRSSVNILTAANAVIANNNNNNKNNNNNSNNNNIFHKQLWTNDKNHNQKIPLFVCENAIIEANTIAEEILRIVDNNVDFDFSQIAILYRTNKQANAFETALSNNNIPCNIYNPNCNSNSNSNSNNNNNNNNNNENNSNYFDNINNITNNINSVKLLTIHSAKGLEFDIVFIVGLENDLLPIFLNKNIQEERRLMYVAITRAKKLLYLSYAKNRNSHFKQISQFINEIPNNLLERRIFL